MFQTYKISETDLPVAAWRTLKKAVKIMVVAFALFIIYVALWYQLSFKTILISALWITPAYALALIIGYAILKRSYSRLRIILNEDGIEFHIPGNYKKINWNNVHIINKPDGTVELHDNQISSFYRIMTGEGSIPLIPEIEHFDKLIAEINKLKTII